MKKNKIVIFTSTVIAAIIIFVMSVMSVFSAAVVENEHLYGDLNNDNKVTVLDTILLQKIMAKIQPSTDEINTYADVDLNGAINISDTIYIQKFIAKNISKLPYDSALEASILRKLTLSDKNITINPDETYQLYAEKTPSTAVAEIIWTSSDQNIAVVDNDGTVTAVSDGTAEITAASNTGNILSRCNVTVLPNATTLDIADSISMGIGEYYTFTATVPEGTYAEDITFSSSNHSLLTIGTGGYSHALEKGTVTVTATASNGAVGKCTVNIIDAPTSVTLSESYLDLAAGEDFDLDYTLPQGTMDNNPRFQSGDPSVATIDIHTGKIHAISSGSIYIRLRTYNFQDALCAVIVHNTPTSVKLNAHSLNVGKGETFTFTREYSQNTYAMYYEFTSSNTNVVTVNSKSGAMKAVGTGNAKVTVTTVNGVSDICTITVQNAPTAVYITPSTLTLRVTQYKVAEFSLPSGCSSREYAFSSSNPSVATIDSQTGRIDAKSAGTSTIKITTYNGKTATCQLTVKPQIPKPEEIVEMINAERAKKNVRPVTLDATLTKASQKRAEELETYYSHSRPDGSSCFTVLSDYNIISRSAGENIAYGYDCTQDVSDAWVASPAHYANIINANFTKVGIGIHQASNGTIYWEQMFTEPK